MTRYSSFKTISDDIKIMASSEQVSNTEDVNIFLRLQMGKASSKEYLAVGLVAKRTY